MARQRTPKPSPPSEVMLELKRLDVGSVVAVVGHPIHVMMVHFPIAFWMGVAASLVGIAELLLVRGIRLHEASWSHAVAAMTLVAIAGANWGMRMLDPATILPHGLALSALGSVMVGFAGWHGGKLVFDHGVGILVSSRD